MAQWFDSRAWRHMWVEFVVGSRPCSERFISGYSGFPLSSKTNLPKFQFYLEFGSYCYVLRVTLYLFIYLFIYYFGMTNKHSFETIFSIEARFFQPGNMPCDV